MLYVAAEKYAIWRVNLGLDSWPLARVSTAPTTVNPVTITTRPDFNSAMRRKKNRKINFDQDNRSNPVAGPDRVRLSDVMQLGLNTQWRN